MANLSCGGKTKNDKAHKKNVTIITLLQQQSAQRFARHAEVGCDQFFWHTLNQTGIFGDQFVVTVSGTAGNKTLYATLQMNGLLNRLSPEKVLHLIQLRTKLFQNYPG